ncbi:hypothetical protein P389DRAFT_168145 [Cystobasidium minutum MCA 4210]|uniref:uncharacterized protein n=1 Tax=Cystobasidium minutum MCA 4210 TaxID=1397322 RepID=UPI0034CDA75C|eukprot:jgi/Rhomi1/168145/fgenesh1_kg.2_\
MDSKNPRADAKHAVLDHYFANVVSLHTYLLACLPSELASQVLDAVIDPASYTTLLQHAYVGYCSPEGDPRQWSSGSQENESLSAVIRRVQRDILADAKVDNVLCLGYTLKGFSVVNRYSNTSLTDLQESPDWKLLLSRSVDACNNALLP